MIAAHLSTIAITHATKNAPGCFAAERSQKDTVNILEVNQGIGVDEVAGNEGYTSASRHCFRDCLVELLVLQRRDGNHDQVGSALGYKFPGQWTTHHGC